MLIALDYDDTFTADPFLWLDFIGSAKKRGYRVMIVTSRQFSTEAKEQIREAVGNVAIVFTGGAAKRWYCENHGVDVPDIWIDDDPGSIINGK